MVNAQRQLIDHLGIEKLLCVAGGSMGGMQALQWLISYPESVRSAIPIATTIKHSPQQIAFNEVGRQAIMSDPNWQNGGYYGGAAPTAGLAVARMIGHITYMSDKSMAEKFGRRLRDYRQPFKFTADFEVEEYLRYQGESFVKRFDANSYLYITKAIDYFDITRGKHLQGIFKAAKARVLIIAFKSDWLYPPYQSQELIRAFRLAGVDANYCEIDSAYGHDAFLLEFEEQAYYIKNFLERISHSKTIEAYEI
jgi:homoserine O-acetyltransferase